MIDSLGSKVNTADSIISSQQSQMNTILKNPTPESSHSLSVNKLPMNLIQ